MKRADMVIDLQFGSTGKGLIAGYLATHNRYDTLMSAWAPNAGHTFIDSNGRKFIHMMVPNGIVSKGLRRIMLGPGSIIDPVTLRSELESVCDIVHKDVEIMIHPSAAVVTQEHRDHEKRDMFKIGSTSKGVGAAAIDRIRRQPDAPAVAWAHGQIGPHPALDNVGLGGLVVSREQYHNAIAAADQVLIEGAQGYSLSMYHGFYPYTTSRDVSASQVLADVGLPPMGRYSLNIIGTARCHPIRVANRFDTEGNMVGWSGPCYPDQRELDWERDLGRPAELTTVTKLPRRIFTWSDQQILEAVKVCAVRHVFLNFLNYLPTRSASERFMSHVVKMIRDKTKADVRYIGFGPTVDDVIDLHEFGDGRRNNPFETKIVRRAFNVPSAKD